MLRSLRSRSIASQPFVCWQCQTRLYFGTSSRLKQSHTGSRSTSKSDGPQYLDTLATRLFDGSSARSIDNNAIYGGGRVRNQLRAWELANPPPIVPEIPDLPMPGAVSNEFSRPKEGEERVVFDADSTPLDFQVFAHDELLDVGSRRGFLLPGDLLEFESLQGSQLAIYVCELDQQSLYYTISGDFIFKSSRSAKFSVPQFVEKSELNVLRPYLPVVTNSPDQQDIPRHVGADLIQKMRSFWEDSEKFYMNNAAVLDKAHKLVADEKHFKYATLDQIAEKVLPLGIPKGKGGKYSSTILWALHRSLSRDSVGFRSMSGGTLRNGGQYEISALHDVDFVDLATRVVREYQQEEIAIGRGARPAKGVFRAFLTKLQSRIDQSRLGRALTTHGTLGPLSKPELEMPKFAITDWNSVEIKLLRFMESWAAFNTFPLHSPLHGVGSNILRATKRYEGHLLDQSTAWAMLQEIGFFPPWQNRAAYDLRLPQQGVGSREFCKPEKQTFREDALAHLREDENLPVYCIDAQSAHEIDDGISLERTDVADEYWVHVHTADPASHIDPHKGLGELSTRLTETVYMPEQVHFMIDAHFVQQSLSLATDRPSITFSAKMNTAGDILEYKISPNTLRDVKFMTPDAVHEVITGELPRPHGVTHELQQGIEPVSRPDEATPINASGRPLIEASQLSESHREDLRILRTIGEARTAHRVAKGGLSVGMQGTDISIPKQGALQKGSADPKVNITTRPAGYEEAAEPRVEVVAPLMLLAAEVAARWCRDRGIPIPYRVTPRNPDRPDPTEYYRTIVLPSLDANGKPPLEIAQQYFRLLGSVVPTTEPGPHLAVGVEMMAKCTSPLRRYGDLLVHWQIGAALLEEARGTSLINNPKEDFLPFSKEAMDAILPCMEAGERMVKRSKHDAIQHWLCHYLVRAWRFKEDTLPATFRTTVTNLFGQSGHHTIVLAQLAPFQASASLKLPDHIDFEDVKIGDVFEAELADVNVYSRTIELNVLKRI